jgi:prostaglandin-E synthase 1
MDNLLSNPTFLVYAIACIVLCFNVLGLWGYSGAVRAKTKTAINKEDAAMQSARLAETDPPEVARVLRAHSNAQASIYPFLFLGLVFVLAGGGVLMAKITFGIFTGARLVHTAVYLAGKQPWRTIVFVIGLLATVALALEVVWLMANAP